MLERLSFEAEAIGFHLTAHPLDAYAQALRRLGAVRASEVEAEARAGVTRVKVAGTVDRHEGADHAHRQPHGLGADFRRVGFGRGHLFQ